MKTFLVAIKDGETAPANQLATFTRYLDGVQFRFVVTQLPLEEPVVTHRLSRKRVCRIMRHQLACCSNVKDAANLAINGLIHQFSETRLRAKLAAAEAAL